VRLRRNNAIVSLIDPFLLTAGLPNGSCVAVVHAENSALSIDWGQITCTAYLALSNTDPAGGAWYISAFGST
jgi:hypothetical protein